MRPKKHILELFTKEDPWPLRLVVLVLWLIFLLVLAGMGTEAVGKWSLLPFLLKRII